jgi:hypothetical protein
MRIPIWLIVAGVVVLAGASAAGGAVVGVKLADKDEVPAVAVPAVDPSQSPLCQDALQRRQIALQALNTKVRIGEAEFSYNPADPPGTRQLWAGAEQQLQQAEQDIKKQCGS